MSGECDKCGEHALECKCPTVKWVNLPDEKLSKKGIQQFVYIPSNYHGPIALDAKIKKSENDKENI